MPMSARLEIGNAALLIDFTPGRISIPDNNSPAFLSARSLITVALLMTGSAERVSIELIPRCAGILAHHLPGESNSGSTYVDSQSKLAFAYGDPKHTPRCRGNGTLGNKCRFRLPVNLYNA